MVLYKEFKVGDLFKAHLSSKQETELKGEIPVISGVTTSNGVIGYSNDRDNKHMYEQEITVSNRGEYSGTAYYQKREFILSNNVICLEAKFEKTDGVMLYITSVINKLDYGGYSNYPTKSGIVEDVLELPVKTLDDTEPDWEYMEEYIKQSEIKYIGKLTEEFNRKMELLQALIGESEGGGRSLESIPTAKFKVLDLFEIKNGKQPPLKKRYHIKEDNMINCITGVTENNGIGFYTTRDKHEIYTNEITLSKDGEYAGTAYLQTKEFMLAGHSTGLISKYPLRKNHLLYISGVLNRYQKMGYWKQGGVMGSVTIKRLKDIDLVLPINPEVSDLEPDWNAMEKYVARTELQLLNRVINTLNT